MEQVQGFLTKTSVNHVHAKKTGDRDHDRGFKNVEKNKQGNKGNWRNQVYDILDDFNDELDCE
jgi:hypothetical protein